MKAILISIRPKWVSKILNGEKTIEIRKSAPKCELPIDVYIYCTKNKLHYNVGALMFNKDDCFKRSVDGTYKYGDSVELMGYSPDYPYDKNNFLNGKIVAKFTLNGIDKFTEGLSEFEFERLTPGEIARSGRPYYKKALKRACLTDEELQRYAPDKSFYAWYIEDLVIFDEPKEPPVHVPQSWCYWEEK